MSACVFDGVAAAADRELLLKQQVATLKFQPKIAAVLFTEDAGSVLYTRKKQEAAERIGIAYESYPFSFDTPGAVIQKHIEQLNTDPEVTGIIVQKPWRRTWLAAQVGMEQASPTQQRAAYNDWWQQLTTSIAVHKDVDGLHPQQQQILPATAKAVVYILEAAVEQVGEHVYNNICIVGKSDLLGFPLQRYFEKQGRNSTLLARKELQQRMQSGVRLTDATTIVTATGTAGLITADMVADGCVVIDVGEPVGDVAYEAVRQKAAFITPVPGGVGPMTVSCLLENCVALCS